MFLFLTITIFQDSSFLYYALIVSLSEYEVEIISLLLTKEVIPKSHLPS